MIWLLAFALPAVVVLAYIAADAARNLARNVARLVRDACRRVRAALADDPYDDSDKHRCPVCYNLDADEANGILRIDFDIWESEPTHDPRV